MANEKNKTPRCSLTKGSPLDGSIRMTRKLAALAIVLLVLVPMAAFGQQDPAEGRVSGDYVIKQSAEFGYRFVGVDGNKSMYNTLENLQEGPRLLDFSLSMRSLNHTGALMDSLYFTNFGYGGDPQSASRLRISKSRWYDFSAMYRHDQNYFDYNLFANPLNPANTVVPNNITPHFFDTRRNMGDFSLTLAPQSPLRVRLGYTRNINEGPSGIGTSLHEGTDIALFNDYQARSDNYQIGVDLKFAPRTNISFDQFYQHNKLDGAVTDAPFRNFVAFNPLTPGVATPINLGLIFDPFYNQPCAGPGTPPVPLTPPVTGNVLTNLSCNVYLNYNRDYFTRTNTHTSQLSFQSNYWKKLDLTAQGSYSWSEMKMPVYNEIAHALITRTNEVGFQFTGPARAERIDGHADLGFTYHFNDHWSLSNQFRWLNWRTPGNWNSNEIACIANTLVGATIFTPPGSPGGATTCLGVPTVGLPARNASSGADITAENFLTFMGEASVFNTATVEWEANKRFAAHLGYRYGNRYLKIKDFTTSIATTFAAPVPVVITPSPDELETTEIISFVAEPCN